MALDGTAGLVSETRQAVKYGVPHTPKDAESLEFSCTRLGQMNPQHCPHPANGALPSTPQADPLGEPMNIAEAARLLGCSVWTVRQRYLPLGLPFFRIGSTGKFLFYRNQIVRWILNKQIQKGGDLR